MKETEILKEYFGHTSFRGGQEQIVGAILSGRDVLGVMPTGAGKSVCYQVPALMLDGLTIVISPLISLMKDQVNALWQAGVRAGLINSSLTVQQAKQTYRAAYAGELDILYVAPERLLSDGFLNMAAQVKIAQVTVDEAHCISQWGQDFRPSYLKIAEFIEKLPTRPVVSAFTATATEPVRLDIKRLLGLCDPLESVTGFDRRNLRFTVYAPKDKFRMLSGILTNNRDKCAIVYCLTRKKTEDVCAKLCAAGFNATRYHAGLSDEERRQNQEDFIYDRKNIMVATNAFGMGIDKSNVGLVVHFNMPKNIESYYQEAGRAGRDGSEAECIMLYNASDVRTNRFLIDNGDDPNPELTPQMRADIRKKDIMRLNKMTEYCRTSGCYRQFILKYFGESAPDYCGNCSNCTADFDAVDITIEAQKIVSCVYRAKQKNKRYGRSMLADILRGADNKKIRESGMDKLSTYNIMSDASKEHIYEIIDFLTEQKYLSEDGEYPIIDITEFSAEIVRQKKQITMKHKKRLTEEQKQISVVYDIDYTLFSRLKQLRMQIARDERVPAYIVFSDAALRDMCRKRPVTAEQFLNVSGVGRLKAQKYGEEFCACIKEYTEEM